MAVRFAWGAMTRRVPEASRSLGETLLQLCQLAQVEVIVCASPVQTTSGWALHRFDAGDLEKASRLRRLLASYLVRSDGAYGWFDPVTPDCEQRNVLVDLQQRIPDAEFHASRICREVLRPLQLHRHRVFRSLIYDGEALLAWFGVVHPEPLDAQQTALLEGALPTLQRRLALERQLEVAPLLDAALAALDDIAAPAFVVASSGRMFQVNDAARALLATRRTEVSQSIMAALADEAGPIPVELTALDEHGAADHWLAVVRPLAVES